MTELVTADHHGQIENTAEMSRDDQEELEDILRHQTVLLSQRLRLEQIQAELTCEHIHQLSRRRSFHTLRDTPIQLLVQVLGNQTTERLLNSSKVQIGPSTTIRLAVQKLLHHSLVASLRPLRPSCQTHRLGLQELLTVRLPARPTPSVAIDIHTLALQSRALRRANRSQASQQILSLGRLISRPWVRLTETPTTRRSRSTSIHPQFETCACSEIWLLGHGHEIFVRRQISVEDHMSRVPHPRTRNESHTRRRSGLRTQPDQHAAQIHALCLVHRERPSQHQRVLLPFYALVRRRTTFVRKDRHPPATHWISRKERQCVPRCILHSDIFEIYENNFRQTQLRIVRTRIATLTPHESFHYTSRTVHQTGLHPQIHSQNDARTYCKVRMQRQAAKLIILHLLALSTLRVGIIAVHGLQLRDFFPSLLRMPNKAIVIHTIRTFCGILRVHLRVHKHNARRTILKLPTTPLTLQQATALKLAKPFVIGTSELPLRHAQHYVAKLVRLAHVLLPLLGRHMLQTLIIQTEHPPQKHHIFNLVNKRLPTHSETRGIEIIIVWILTAGWQILPLPPVRTCYENAVITDRRHLLQITHLQNIQSAHRWNIIRTKASPRHFVQSVLNHIIHLSVHSSPNHAHLIVYGEPGVLQFRLSLHEPIRPSILHFRDISDTNTIQTVHRGSTVFHLKRRTSRRSAKDHGMLHILFPHHPLHCRHTCLTQSHDLAHDGRLPRTRRPKQEHPKWLVTTKILPALITFSSFLVDNTRSKTLPGVWQRLLIASNIIIITDVLVEPRFLRSFQPIQLRKRYRRTPLVTSGVDQIISRRSIATTTFLLARWRLATPGSGHAETLTHTRARPIINFAHCCRISTTFVFPTNTTTLRLLIIVSRGRSVRIPVRIIITIIISSRGVPIPNSTTFLHIRIDKLVSFFLCSRGLTV